MGSTKILYISLEERERFDIPPSDESKPLGFRIESGRDVVVGEGLESGEGGETIVRSSLEH